MAEVGSFQLNCPDAAMSSLLLSQVAVVFLSCLLVFFFVPSCQESIAFLKAGKDVGIGKWRKPSALLLLP